MIATERGGHPATLSDEDVRLLLDAQLPELADEDIGRRQTLEDHLVVRIGDHHAALFPRYPDGDALYARMGALLAPHADRWSFPAGAPVATGRPGHGFPYHWVVVEWTATSNAALVPLRGAAIRALGKALREVHVPAPDDAPGGPRTSRRPTDLRPAWERLLDDATCLHGPSGEVIDPSAADAIFRDAEAAPLDLPRCWTHGRLEPRAVRSDRGWFAGLVLWHCFGAGDPAADLGYAAILVPPEHRGELVAGYGGVSEATAARALGYQLFAALRYLDLEDPFLHRIAWERLADLGLTRAPAAADAAIGAGP